jgi:hypothetical protein
MLTYRPSRRLAREAIVRGVVSKGTSRARILTASRRIGAVVRANARAVRGLLVASGG